MNSKTLILKDSSVRSIWTYVTASPCYTISTKSTTTLQERQRQTERQTERQTDRERERETVVGNRATQQPKEEKAVWVFFQRIILFAFRMAVWLESHTADDL